jgi:hypothetical protein
VSGAKSRGSDAPNRVWTWTMQSAARSGRRGTMSTSDIGRWRARLSTVVTTARDDPRVPSSVSFGGPPHPAWPRAAQNSVGFARRGVVLSGVVSAIMPNYSTIVSITGGFVRWDV